MSFNPVRIIEKKRDGGALSREEIEFIAGAASGAHRDMSEAQLAAWLMAVVWRGMTIDETVALTDAMVRSGEQVDLSGLPKPWVDKHSTGGVGDKTTLVVLPLMAACGLTCVKMSGRGLGKTGGTIDKLESIPGFRTGLDLEELKAQALRIGLALTGQTPRLTPADGALYALRDVTGTVRSIPLIASSVLSKKIAGGAEVISIDLKCGSGAFMESLEDARALAATMREVAQRLGKRLTLEITDMDQPLGVTVGNLLEVQEAILALRGEASPRFAMLCVDLVASALQAGGVAASLDDARLQVQDAWQSGRGAAKLAEWFVAQGATVSPEEVLAMPGAPCKREVSAESDGYVARLDAGMIGEAVVELGGGRKQKGDTINPAVGVELMVEVGDQVRAGQPWVKVHAASEADLQVAAQALRQAIHVVPQPVPSVPVILERLDSAV